MLSRSQTYDDDSDMDNNILHELKEEPLEVTGWKNQDKRKGRTTVNSPQSSKQVLMQTNYNNWNHFNQNVRNAVSPEASLSRTNSSSGHNLHMTVRQPSYKVRLLPELVSPTSMGKQTDKKI